MVTDMNNIDNNPLEVVMKDTNLQHEKAEKLKIIDIKSGKTGGKKCFFSKKEDILNWEMI